MHVGGEILSGRERPHLQHLLIVGGPAIMSTAHQTLPTSGSHVHTLGILKTHILDLEGRIHALKEEKLAAERLVSAIEGSESDIFKTMGPLTFSTTKIESLGLPASDAHKAITDAVQSLYQHGYLKKHI